MEKINLKKRINNSYKPYLVFTSAGDNSNLHYWLHGLKDFDLFVSYYGNESEKYMAEADYYIEKKGAKFPGVHFVYTNYREILENYSAILVMDDDLIISGQQITELFNIREKENLNLLQASFDRRGKVSFWHNLVRPFSYLRYTNFVEVACPLFKMDDFMSFMNVYDPKVIGWGVDWWYSQHINGIASSNKAAIVDSITCINPKDELKSNKEREIDKYQSTEDRKKNWEQVARRNGLLISYPIEDIGQVRKFGGFGFIIKSIKILVRNEGYLIFKKITRGRVYPRS